MLEFEWMDEEGAVNTEQTKLPAEGDTFVILTLTLRYWATAFYPLLYAFDMNRSVDGPFIPLGPWSPLAQVLAFILPKDGPVSFTGYVKDASGAQAQTESLHFTIDEAGERRRRRRTPGEEEASET